MQESYCQEEKLTKRKPTLPTVDDLDESGCEDVDMQPSVQITVMEDSEDLSMEEDSAEENDVVVPPTQVIPFRQIDYLWLFNPFVHFEDRPGFKLEDGSLSVEDYSQMRYVNRHLLTKFLSDRQDNGIVMAAVNFSEVCIDE